jgi:hypothetical protein
MNDNWNELMERETQQFQADMLNDELAIANKANAINARLAYEYHNEVKQLTAENAKLREQLAAAVGLLYEAFHDGYQGCPMDGTEWLANAYKVLKANGNSGRALEWYERKPK